MRVNIKPINKSKKIGQKRRFLLFGLINFFITNLFLQISLLIIPIFFATVLSQIINTLIGYYLYGKKVFKLNQLNFVVFRKYFSSASILWFLNFSFIQIFSYLGYNKNLTAILLIPFLVIFSYLMQKKYVFS